MGQIGNYKSESLSKTMSIKEALEKGKKVAIATANEEKKPVNLLGFDKIAGDMKSKVEKLGRQKGISSFTIMGVPTKGVPKYSGGMVGDAVILVEGLFNMATQRPEIKALLEITVKALKHADFLKITDLDELHKEGFVSEALYISMHNNDVFDLKEIAENHTKEVVTSLFDEVSEELVQELEKLLHERGLDFKKNA